MGTAAEAARMLQGVADRLADMTPIMEVVAADVRLLIDDSFAGAKSPNGAAWQALSHTTERIAPRRIGGIPLSDTTRLRRSITTATNRRGFKLGTNVIYAAAQHFGNPANRVFGNAPGPVPARPFLPITSDGRDVTPAPFWAEQRRAIAHWLKTGEFPS